MYQRLQSAPYRCHYTDIPDPVDATVLCDPKPQLYKNPPLLWSWCAMLPLLLFTELAGECVRASVDSSRQLQCETCALASQSEKAYDIADKVWNMRGGREPGGTRNGAASGVCRNLRGESSLPSSLRKKKQKGKMNHPWKNGKLVENSVWRRVVMAHDSHL